MALATTFWETFFLLLIFVPLAMIWAFALIDIFRREDIGGLWKAIWVVCVVLVPFFGTLVYLIVRPAGATREERIAIEDAKRTTVARYTPDSAASQLQVLAELHDRGKLTDSEFEAEKARVLGSTTAAPSEPEPAPGPGATSAA